MDDHGGPKVNGIRQIVRLKEILHKWHHATIGQKAGQNKSSKPSSPGGISPAISKRLKGCNVYVDLDEDNCQSPDPPHDVPKGYLAVYVGPELRRFIIPTSYLSDPLFKVLLEKVEEEYGFDHSGGLTIPCETETFKYLLQCMENHQKEHGVLDKNQLNESDVHDKNRQKEHGVLDKNHLKESDVHDKNRRKEHDADHDKNHQKEHDVCDKAEKSLGHKD